MEKSALIQKVLKSKVLTPRQRWIVVRKIKDDQTSEEELGKIESVIASENEYLAVAKENVGNKYIEDLGVHKVALETLYHDQMSKKINKAEAAEQKKDEAEADDILNDIND